MPEAEMPSVIPAEFFTCPGANPHPGTAALRRAGPVQKERLPRDND